MNKLEAKLGFWSAILSAVFSILWFVTFSLKDVIQTVPDWKDMQAYADAFQMVRLSYVYPSLLLALTYIILLVCIYQVVTEEKKVWSLIGLSTGIIYSAMASINYNIQAVAVRLSLKAGETSGIEMLIPDNTNSIFNALANSYIYLAISMVFIGFIFTEGKNEKWIRRLLLAQIVTAIGQVSYSMFDTNGIIFMVTSMVWIIGAPIAFVLIAFWFRKKYKNV